MKQSLSAPLVKFHTRTAALAGHFVGSPEFMLWIPLSQRRLNWPAARVGFTVGLN